MSLNTVLQGLGLNMSGFRAINRPSVNPLKPAAEERPLPNATISGQKSMQPSVMIRLPDKQSEGQSKRKMNLSQAVAKAKKNSKKLKEKKKESASSTLRPRRQQASREAKLVQSIEFSPPKTTGSPTPGYCTDGAEDSDFIPSRAELQGADMSSPSRRSPRGHPSSNPTAKLSPQAASSLAVSKRESSPTLEPIPKARSPSPLIWSTPTRQKIYDEKEFVELPKTVFQYEQSEKEMRKELAVRKEAMMAEKRKEKGKFSEQRLASTYDSTKKMHKRKGRESLEQNEPRKRQKLVSSDVPQTDKQKCARWSPKDQTTEEQAQSCKALLVKVQDRSDTIDAHSKPGMEATSETSKNKRVQRPSGTGTEAKDCQMHAERPGQSTVLAPRCYGRQELSHNEKWRASFKRREVKVPESFQFCSCRMLPDYFTSNPKRIPSLDTWQGSKLEFLEHVKQICSCQGSIHPRHVVDACRRILAKHDYPKRWENDIGESVFEFGQRILFTDVGKDSNLRRAQSSIPPPIFYGYGSRHRPDPSTGSSSRSVPQPLKDLGTGSTNHSVPLVLTPPNSSSLGQRRKAGVNGDLNICDNSPPEQGNVGVRRIQKALPEAFNGLDRPQFSFEIQRKRHQSVPVNMLRRDTTADQRNPAKPPSVPQPRGTPFQELTSNALIRNMDKRIATLTETIQRLVPATAPAHVSAIHPIPAPPLPPPAPPATVTVTAQGEENRNEQHAPAAKSRKRLSYSDRQRKQPKIDRHVPEHLRHTDEDIVEIGRIVNHYERHVKAPEAFSWRGRLYAKYKKLLVRSVDGVPVWSAEEISRLRD